MKLITALLIFVSASLMLATVSGKELAKSALVEGQFTQEFRCSRLRPCPGSLCCSAWGYCGTTEPWCSPDAGCVSNCWTSAKAVATEEGTSAKELAKSALVGGQFTQELRCNRLRPCPGNLCCSAWGYCGTTEPWCSPDAGCVSNCWASAKGFTVEEGTSAKELAKSALVGGQFTQELRCNRLRPCPGNLCCSAWGYCGTTEPWCSPDAGCVSNCWASLKKVTDE